MANQTISSGTVNFDTLTGLLAGEAVTINGGATLVINSDPQLNRVLAGSFTVNDGLFFIDGTTVRELSFSGASSLPAIGDTLTAGSVTGQVIGVLGNTTAGTVRLRSLNGAINNGAALSFTGGKTATAASADRVGWLNILFAETRSISLPRLGTLKIQGQWYELGVSNGAASQTFQYFCTSLCQVVWVETGAGTNQWIRYINAEDRFSATGSGLRGNYFTQTLGNATITFGDGTTGNIPPNGARIRVPNIAQSTATTAAPTTPTRPSSAGNYLSANTTGGGIIDCEIANFAVFSISSSRSERIRLDNISISSADLTLPNDFDVSNLSVISIGSGNTRSFNINDALNVSVTGVLIESRNIQNCSINRCRNISFYDCIFSFRLTNNERCIEVNNSDIVNFYNCTFSGGNAISTSCTQVLVKNSTLIRAWGKDTYGANSPAISFSSCSEATVDGVLNSVLNYRHLISLANTRNFKLKNFNSISSPQPSPVSEIFVQTTTTSGYSLNRLFFSDSPPNWMSSDMGQVEYVDVRCSYSNNSKFVAATNLVVKGAAGTASLVSSVSGVRGFHFADVFTSATTGCLHIYGYEKTEVSPSVNSYQITGGTPKFNGSGSVLLRSVGDRIEWTWPWFVLGHTGFQNIAFTFSGTNQSNHLFQYQIDTGSGFGAWKTLNAPNLSAETISFTTGFRLKVAAECVTANSSNAIAGILIHTTTTATAQQTLYPIGETVTLTVFSAPPGATVAIYRISDDLEIYKGFADSLGVASTTYTYEGVPVPVRVACRLAGYVAREEEAPIGSTGLSIPMRLERDLTDNLAD